jgi:hypothetical protein
MPLSKAERAAINRSNAQMSTGPTSPAGKDRSRRNAVRHGLCAQVLSLPNEDPRTGPQRLKDWVDHYQPQSPAAVHLVTECARATLQADRLHRCACAMATRDIYEAQSDDDRRRGINIQSAKDGIDPMYDPAEALKELAETGAGCRAMLERWVWYLCRLQSDDPLPPKSGPELMRMLGYPPGAVLKHDPDGWVLHLLGALAIDLNKEERLAELFDPSQMPDCLVPVYRRDSLPDRDAAAEQLWPLVKAGLDRWADREAVLRLDVPVRARAADRAAVPKDVVAARLLVRYQSEARVSFHQAYKALLTTLEYDAEHAPDAPEPDAPPNEANPADSVPEPLENQEVIPTPPAAEPPPAAAPRAARWAVAAEEPSRPSVPVSSSPPEPHRRA